MTKLGGGAVSGRDGHAPDPSRIPAMAVSFANVIGLPLYISMS